MDNEQSQRQAVLKHLMENGSITSLEAFRAYGITRLADIIYRLRKTYPIKTTTCVTKNRYGHTTRYAKYTMMEEGLRYDY